MNEEQTEKITLDLTRKNLKKVPKQEDAQNYKILILDENDLSKIDNIDSYLKIEKLSLGKNQLLRMYGVCRLHCLKELNLSYNGILTIEGLKELVNLTHLNLEGNSIKTIEHLNTNINLEYLNLSINSIGSITDISFLKCLKELNLHGNRLTHLRQCDKYLPVSLQILKLDNNSISDLNEICTLSNLSNLDSITINDNPCVQMTAGADGFDHRPFVLNWCMSVKIIDGFMVDPIESLKAEWLYSQGRGRQFRVGEQASLAKYLSSVCPMLGKALENENDRKLRLILSKAQQHQRQLQEESTDGSQTPTNNSPSSSRKKQASRIQSPRFSRLSGRQGSPDSMSSSYHGNTSSMSSNESQNQNHLIQMSTSLIENIKNDSLMSQSYDASFNSSAKSYGNSSQESTPRTMTPNMYNDQMSSSLVSQNCGPLAAASKMVPVPEALMSPDCCPALVAQRATVSVLNHQMNHTKNSKTNDHKISSPKMRSPHLKRTSERSPTKSPRKVNSSQNCTPRNTNEHRLKSRAAPIISMNIKHNNNASSNISSEDDDSDHINVDKLKTIRNKAAQRSQQQREIKDLSAVNINPQTEASAILIQKIWRGFHTRRNTKYIAEQLLKKRTHEYIEKLAKDMELTKAQLENERKIQQLQMQAINALWKKVSTMQSGVVNSTPAGQTNNGPDADPIGGQTVSLDNSSSAIVSDLTKTCSVLTSQVQQLQGSMRDIVNCMTLLCNQPQETIRQLISTSVPNDQKDSLGTQTEIVAVHTPQVENFPFKVRPSSLPLDTTDNVINRHLSNQVMNEKDENLSQESRTSASEKIDDVQEQSKEDKLNAENLIISKEPTSAVNICGAPNQTSEC